MYNNLIEYIEIVWKSKYDFDEHFDGFESCYCYDIIDLDEFVENFATPSKIIDNCDFKNFKSSVNKMLKPKIAHIEGLNFDIISLNDLTDNGIQLKGKFVDDDIYFKYIEKLGCSSCGYFSEDGKIYLSKDELTLDKYG